MKKFLDVISMEMEQAFKAAGYDEKLGKVTISNRPDLCEYQCNGAMAGAKLYKKAPIMIAPAMNTAMYENIATQENIKILKQENQTIMESPIQIKVKN